MKFQFKTILCLGLFIALASCNSKPVNERFTIVTTTGIIGDCISEIVGNSVDVISLMGPGVDPHLYKASYGDLQKLSNADIIVYNGLHLEGRMAETLEKYGETKRVYAVGDYVTKSKLKPIEGSDDLHDPHIWFNPGLWMEGIHGVAMALDTTAELAGTLDRFEEYNTVIEATQKQLKLDLDSNLSPESRVLITSHDAFEYFGDAFSFKVRGLQGISTAAEHSVKDVNDLANYIMDNNVKAVFVESSVNSKNLQSVVESCNKQNYELGIGGSLYSDALGGPDTKAGTYNGMLKTNIETIINGLK